VLSSRRVKKGPGRRPQSAKRQQFMELRSRGWSIMAAAREVGVSRTAGNNWSRGYKTYRNGQVSGFVPALDRLAVRQISERYLSQDERIEIADLRHAGLGIRQIADRLGRVPSTISRELRRNATASWLSAVRGAPPGDREWCSQSAAPRDQRRAAAAGRRVAGPAVEPGADQPSAAAAIPRPASNETLSRKHLPAGIAADAPVTTGTHHRSPLRTGRDHRRAHQHAQRRRPRFEQPMLTIRRRPFDPLDRSQAGHWEGDLIIGKDQGSAIGTLVERQTRMVRLLHMPYRDSDTLHDALRARMADLPPALLRSITWDQGTEMARHRTITRSQGAPVYFCDSHSPWQRGSNENMNGSCATTSQGHRPERPLATTPARRRERAQQPPQAHPPGPGPSRNSSLRC
jgi:transposase, IS30 family